MHERRDTRRETPTTWYFAGPVLLLAVVGTVCSSEAPSEDENTEAHERAIVLPMSGTAAACDEASAATAALQNLQNSCQSKCFEPCFGVTGPNCFIAIGEAPACNGGPLWQCTAQGACDTKCTSDYDCGSGRCVSGQCCYPNLCTGRCGVVPDGCGGVQDCGGCPWGNCQNNVCCVPQPSCTGNNCGPVPDGCGGTLYCECNPGLSCYGGQCRPDLCQPEGFECWSDWDCCSNNCDWWWGVCTHWDLPT